MRLVDLMTVLDWNVPVWINDGTDTPERYDSILKAPYSVLGKDVYYVTLDGENEITIEVKKGE